MTPKGSVITKYPIKLLGTKPVLLRLRNNGHG